MFNLPNSSRREFARKGGTEGINSEISQCVLDSFSAVPRVSGLVFIFCARGLVFSSTEGVGSRFHFCAPGIVFGGSEEVVSRFHILRSHTRFRRYRGRQLPFSCFARPDSFSAVPRVLGPGSMFCVPRHIFGGTEGIGSCFNVLRVRTSFPWYRGRRVPFLWFAHPDLFSAVTGATRPVFMFFAPGLIFRGTGAIGSLTRFRRFQGC
jgi:hypothetical protein